MPSMISLYPDHEGCLHRRTVTGVLWVKPLMGPISNRHRLPSILEKLVVHTNMGEQRGSYKIICSLLR